MRPTLASLLAGLLLIGCTPKQETIRILTAGIAHESNSFNTIQTVEKDFIIDSGDAALENQEWARYLKGERVEIIPVVHARANPSGTVARATYESFKMKFWRASKRLADWMESFLICTAP